MIEWEEKRDVVSRRPGRFGAGFQMARQDRLPGEPETAQRLDDQERVWRSLVLAASFDGMNSAAPRSGFFATRPADGQQFIPSNEAASFAQTHNP
ncbi:hypothetical protein [Paraburkholderia saeva]|uniref:hypothetical protein n=1 Tax=Paraburkholderia saeva TaxID=2777537 RepID=UPI001E445C65|nr:hypothetical protein [Paraburkholderia saeva]